jgi:4-hydroxybutyrate dehydrogenase
MKNFSVRPVLHECKDFGEFASEFKLNKNDLILTQEFIFNPYMKHLGLDCHFVFQEKFGAGEPSDEMTDSILDSIKDIAFHRVIAVGGGTVIDIAKVITLKNVHKLDDAFANKAALEKEKELIIVPTTCGTGSEVTNIAIFMLKAKHTKMGLAADQLFADHAVLIPQMIESLPYPFFIFSSVDALIHSFESYVSPKANSFTEIFSVAAIEKILNGYMKLAKEGKEARSSVTPEILIASDLAGIAFGNAGVGAVHALSYPIGANFHVAHGEANYIFFVEVFKKYNQKNPDGKIKDLNQLVSRILNVKEETQIYPKLAELLNKMLPLKKLREYGVVESEIEGLADNVVANQQRLLVNNYVPLSRDEIRDIFKELF